MREMFFGCKSLKDITCLGDWNMSNIRNMEFMFFECNELENLKSLREENVSNVKTIAAMFEGCSRLKVWPDWIYKKAKNRRNGPFGLAEIFSRK
jgi:surface protein